MVGDSIWLGDWNWQRYHSDIMFFSVPGPCPDEGQVGTVRCWWSLWYRRVCSPKALIWCLRVWNNMPYAQMFQIEADTLIYSTIKCNKGQ